MFIPSQIRIPVRSAIDLNATDDATDSRDRIQIEKIYLEIPFYFCGSDSLERGVWHRYPEHGDPIKGGNFILSAHRFRIAQDLILIKERSPFYNLDRVVVGDKIRFFLMVTGMTTVLQKFMMSNQMLSRLSRQVRKLS